MSSGPTSRDAPDEVGSDRAHDRVAVIDFGGQYAHLIATKVRHQGVLAEIRQPEDPIEAFRPYKGIILSGSPSLSAYGEDSGYTKEIYDLDIPILGLCFGHQEIAKHYGGEVVHGGREWGRAELRLTVDDHPLLEGLDPCEVVWMSHYDSVVEVGPEFRELGYSAASDGRPEHRYAAIGSDSLRRYGFQFHCEVDDTVHGERMLANFVRGICGCRPTWSMDRYLDRQVDRIRAQVGDRSVFLLASGGVDSTVVAALLGEALDPGRLRLLHIDNGLMRKGESSQVLEAFDTLGLGDRVHFVDASGAFLAALEGIVDPEKKRRAIGDTFIQVFHAEAERLSIEDHLLAQGTIYPDTIETGGTVRADTIKTHHNRVPVIEELLAEGRVVEPLAELYKAEVRQLGERLGLPDAIVRRHPFPGPGLGIRALCSRGEADLDDGERGALAAAAREAATIGARFGFDALLLPIRSVGVKADLRAYEHPVMLTGSGDPDGGAGPNASAGGGADAGATWDRLLEATSVLTAEVPSVNRCVWNLAPSAPRGARLLPATVTRERLDLLREADALVMETLRRHGLYDTIWQCPTVLVPLQLDGGEPGSRAGELVVVRPVRSKRAMTATPAELPPAALDELRATILALDGVCGLALDVTSKPPGTIEWE